MGYRRYWIPGQFGPIWVFFTKVKVLTNFSAVNRSSGIAVIVVDSRSSVVSKVRLLKDGGRVPPR
jgi:hypothetical protein